MLYVLLPGFAPSALSPADMNQKGLPCSIPISALFYIPSLGQSFADVLWLQKPEI
jgi:hypothetical protein